MLKQYHHMEFDQTDLLIKKKQDQNLFVSLVLPTLNEANTIGHIVGYILKNLTNKNGLIDEIIVIDGGSTDGTADVAQSEGAKVYDLSEVVSEVDGNGKGIALWKSQFVTKGDILLFIDSDIIDFDKRFVNGLLGPLLNDKSIDFVKAFYKRPLCIGSERYENYGGRVTEILVRPLLSSLVPDLAQVFQPLAGEYAIRRSIADQLPFWSGYGIEVGLLMDFFSMFGLSSLAQVDMENRHHRNRSVHELGRMAFSVLQVVMNRCERMGIMTFDTEPFNTLIGLNGNREECYTFNDIELPPRNDMRERELTNAGT